MEQCVQSTFRSGRQGLMIWGALAYDKKWPLLRIDLQPSRSNGKTRTKAETLKGEKYANEILKGPLSDYVKEMQQDHRHGVQVVEDGAGPHKSKLAKAARAEIGYECLVHPSNSPDLNAIEPLWAQLKRRVRKMQPMATSLDGLWTQIQAAYDDIPQSAINHQVDLMKDRMEALKRNKGRQTRY